MLAVKRKGNDPNYSEQKTRGKRAGKSDKEKKKGKGKKGKKNAKPDPLSEPVHSHIAAVCTDSKSYKEIPDP